jgi:hypothetical protein
VAGPALSRPGDSPTVAQLCQLVLQALAPLVSTRIGLMPRRRDTTAGVRMKRVLRTPRTEHENLTELPRKAPRVALSARIAVRGLMTRFE